MLEKMHGNGALNLNSFLHADEILKMIASQFASASALVGATTARSCRFSAFLCNKAKTEEERRTQIPLISLDPCCRITVLPLLISPFCLSPFQSPCPSRNRVGPEQE